MSKPVINIRLEYADGECYYCHEKGEIKSHRCAGSDDLCDQVIGTVLWHAQYRGIYET